MTCKSDAEFEHLITYKIVVDCYDEYEAALGWYYYLEDNLNFPFHARCIKALNSSPLQHNECVLVTGMAGEDDCQSTMMVQIKWQDRTLAVRLEQLTHDEDTIDEETLEALDAWDYWIERGYSF